MNKVVDVEFYHRAILLKKDVRPLQGLNIVFSTYTSSERDFYYCLARALGGEVNDRYIRSESPILICPTPEGKKYIGAIKWSKCDNFVFKKLSTASILYSQQQLLFHLLCNFTKRLNQDPRPLTVEIKNKTGVHSINRALKQRSLGGTLFLRAENLLSANLFMCDNFVHYWRNPL